MTNESRANAIIGNTLRIIASGEYHPGEELTQKMASYIIELEQKLTDMSVQLANAESKCGELAAENSTIKVMNDCLSEEMRGYESDGAFEGPKMHLLWWKAETPATDAFLAEMRAQGVEMLLASLPAYYTARADIAEFAEFAEFAKEAPVSKINYQALRKAAEKAGKDKWQAKKINGDFFVIRHGSYTRQYGYTTYQSIAEIADKPVREFVALANPATVLALLDELESTTAKCDLWYEKSQDLEAVKKASEKRIAKTNKRNTELTAKIEPMNRCIAELELLKLTELPGRFSLDEARELHTNLVNSYISKAISSEKMKLSNRNNDLAWIKEQLIRAAWFVQASIEAYSAAGISVKGE